ncbi:MAG TPA: STAS domain-containing protein [Mycobacteriales bacterium]|nr:STAS domain-containing protein [Mycobacteriales bacterium]
MDLATVDLAIEGSSVTLRLRGEFDLPSAPILRVALVDALRRGTEVVLDCTDVTFIDVVALNVILSARQRAAAHGQVFVISNPPAGMRRIASALALNLDG